MLVSVIRIKDVAGADRSILYRSRFDIFCCKSFCCSCCLLADVAAVVIPAVAAVDIATFDDVVAF